MWVSQKGQVGLVLLVVMAVVVAIAMSVASRSLSDTVISRQEGESAAAFSVAETGIENALNLIRQGTLPGGTVALTDSTGLINGQFEVTPLSSFALYLREREVAQIDLTGFGGGNLNISWTRIDDDRENITTCIEGSGTMPAALEVSAGTSGGTVERAYYNPFGCVIPGNGFANSLDGGEYLSSGSYAVPLNSGWVRIGTVYSGATVTVSGAGITEDQMYVVQSSAGGSEAQKEIEVKRGVDAPAPVFDFALFSGTTIIK